MSKNDTSFCCTFFSIRWRRFRHRRPKFAMSAWAASSGFRHWLCKLFKLEDMVFYIYMCRQRFGLSVVFILVSNFILVSGFLEVCSPTPPKSQLCPTHAEITHAKIAMVTHRSPPPYNQSPTHAAKRGHPRVMTSQGALVAPSRR